MRLTPDDPKLTAYALGELPAAERAAVEAELKQSPDCRRAVGEIRAMSGMLEQELAEEACPALSASATANVLAALPKSRSWLERLFAFESAPRARWKFELALAGYASAVTLALVAVLVPLGRAPHETVAVVPGPVTNANAQTVQQPSVPETVSPPAPPRQVVVEQPPVPAPAPQPVLPKVNERPTPRTPAVFLPKDAVVSSPAVAPSNVVVPVNPPGPAPVVIAQAVPPPAPRDLAPLALKLPMPSFKGTPDDLPKGEHIEEFTDKPRTLFLAPAGVRNLALNKKVTASDKSPITGSVSQITDDNMEAIDDAVVELHKGLQWVQIDLEQDGPLYAIVLWHDHRYVQVFRCVVVQAADDSDFTQNVRTFFNNDYENVAGLGIGSDKQYFETNQGKLIDLKGAKARYLRFYSRGSNASALNCYTEIEVWGLPGQ